MILTNKISIRKSHFENRTYSFGEHARLLFESRHDFLLRWLCESKDTPTQAHHRTHCKIGNR